MKLYTCPMHLEVVMVQPGDCPKCGMKLVEEGSEGREQVTSNTNSSVGKISLGSYLPLITLIGLILLTTLAISYTDLQKDNFSLTKSISYFMIGFFLTFSGFKLIDLKGFAQGYHQYDLLAKVWFNYGYIFPFVELFFALSMIIGFFPQLILWSEVVIMSFSGIGVVIKLLKREKFQCVCLGTTLKVPLTFVTLIENFGMAALALLVLELSQF